MIVAFILLLLILVYGLRQDAPRSVRVQGARLAVLFLSVLLLMFLLRLLLLLLGGREEDERTRRTKGHTLIV